MFCPKCGHNNMDGVGFCNACGNAMAIQEASPGQPQMPMQQPGMYPQNLYQPPVIVTRTSGMAIAGFVLSFFCGLLGLIFSIIGYNECNNSNGEVTGGGLAMAGIIISIFSMLIGLIMMAGG